MALGNIEVHIGHIVGEGYNTVGKNFQFNFLIFGFWTFWAPIEFFLIF